MRPAAMLLAATLLLACDDTNERRASAILATRGTDTEAADRGAAELEKILEKTPRDRLALYGLAQFYQSRGRIDDARYLYERLSVAAAGFEEGERAKEELTKIGLPAASTDPASSAPRPGASEVPALAATAITFGKGIVGVTLGMPQPAAEKVVGKCDREAAVGGATVCTLLGRGMEIVYKDGKVTRVGLYGAGREIIEGRGARVPFRAFVGAAEGGIELGMTAAAAETTLGAPTTRRAPSSALITREGSITMELWDYPKKGVTLEIDQTVKGPIVSGIQIPTIEGRPLPAPGGKP